MYGIFNGILMNLSTGDCVLIGRNCIVDTSAWCPARGKNALGYDTFLCRQQCFSPKMPSLQRITGAKYIYIYNSGEWFYNITVITSLLDINETRHCYSSISGPSMHPTSLISVQCTPPFRANICFVNRFRQIFLKYIICNGIQCWLALIFPSLL